MTMEPNFYFNRTLVRDFAALLHSYNRDEFDSPRRSTVPLLALVRDKQNTLHKILTACQAPMPVDFHFEFKVEHQSKGRGKPSQTDLMAICDTVCIAIEAKWTEPPYESVASWLTKGADKSNRKEVLKGWLTLLSPEGTPLSSDEVADCEYQMLHRAASACAAASSFSAKKRPMLTYFKFTSPDVPNSAASREYYRAALALLHERILRSMDFRFFLVEIQMAPSEQFGLIANLPKAAPTTGISVRGALQEAPLFNFLSCKVEQIGA
jgi:hypothetical protein